MGIKDRNNENASPVVRKFLNVEEFKIPQGEGLHSAISSLKKDKRVVEITEIPLTRERIFATDVKDAAIVLVSNSSLIQMIIKALYPKKKILPIENPLDMEEIYLALKYELPEVTIPDDKVSEIESILKLLK